MAEDIETQLRPIVTREEARAAGLKRYFTGEPCKHGHICDRLTRNKQCVLCKKRVAESWRARNAEKARTINQQCGKAWRDANQVKQHLACVEWRAKNKARVSAYNAAYRLANLPTITQRMNAWRDANRKRLSEYSTEWKRSNPEKVSHIHRIRYARRKKAAGSYSLTDIQNLLTLQKFKCVYCRKSLKPRFHADHITPLSKGGSNDISNIQLLCPRCNSRKHAKDAITFAQSIGMLL